MALTTFGAIMEFALEVVGETEEIYKILFQRVKHPVLKEALHALLNEAGKDRSLMEQARRENVTEMILEPITGLNRDAYHISLNVTDLAEDVDFLKTALILEERERKFFQEASSKMPLPEAARIFRKIAQKKERNLNHLRSIQFAPF